MPQVQTQGKIPVRVPLVGVHNTRMFSTSPTGSSSIVGIMIVGRSVVGNVNTFSTKDQRYINAIPEKITDPLTGLEFYSVYKRPGLAANTTPAAGNIGTAIKVWTGSSSEVISAFGGTNSTLYSGTTSLGSVTGLINDITETVVGTTPTLVVATDGNKAYYYPLAGALTQITDVDFPGNAGKTITGTFVHHDGYAFIMCTDGTIYNSDLSSVSAWTSSSFISANMYPDKGVGLAKYKDLVVAFGKESIEFFRDVGNAVGSPLQKVTEATIKIGCISATSICQMEDNVAWIAGSDIGSESVYILNGYQPTRISSDVIDAAIAQRGDTSIYLTSCKINGKTLLFVIFNAATYVYCVEDKVWHEWQSSTILWHKFSVSSSTSSSVYAVSRVSTSGKTYILNLVSPVYQDDGTNYQFFIQTAKVDMNNEYRKFLRKLTIVGDTQSSATLDISWSDDDYTTLSTARTIDLSLNRKYINNCGSFRRRSFVLSTYSAEPIRLEALELVIDQGIH